jgi:Hemerythrin HHE cation binding domain
MPKDFPQLGDVREQRAGLRTAMLALEAAAAAPQAGRDEAWRTELGHGLAEVCAAWDRHVAITESPAGLFAQIRADAPALAPRITRLRREHKQLRAALDAVTSNIGSDPRGVRERVVDIVAKLARHRQHGSDVIYEAYSVDLGGHG